MDKTIEELLEAVENLMTEVRAHLDYENDSDMERAYDRVHDLLEEWE